MKFLFSAMIFSGEEFLGEGRTTRLQGRRKAGRVAHGIHLLQYRGLAIWLAKRCLDGRPNRSISGNLAQRANRAYVGNRVEVRPLPVLDGAGLGAFFVVVVKRFSEVEMKL
jgi:hypothetical protein